MVDQLQVLFVVGSMLYRDNCRFGNGKAASERKPLGELRRLRLVSGMSGCLFPAFSGAEGGGVDGGIYLHQFYIHICTCVGTFSMYVGM